jgi:hypothetical protein
MFSVKKLYSVKSFPRGKRILVAKKVKEFNKEAATIVADIVGNGKECGLTLRKSPHGGRGIFTNKGVPPRTDILVYPGLITPTEAHTGSQMYVFSLDEVDFGEGYTEHCALDGKPAIDALDRLKKKPRLQKSNGGLHNHSCRKWNLVGDWRSEPKTGMAYVVYSTGAKGIAAGQELLSDYNLGVKMDRKHGENAYWHKISKLIANGCPEDEIEACGCSKKKRLGKWSRCPNKYGYDSRRLRGDLP